MTVRYRVGRSWGVTVVRERPDQPDQLVGTMQRPEDAQLIANALNMLENANAVEANRPDTQSCPEYPDGQHRSTESLIPASYAACRCGWRGEYNPDRFA